MTLPKPMEDRVAELRDSARDNRVRAMKSYHTYTGVMLEVLAEIQDLRADAVHRQMDGGGG